MMGKIDTAGRAFATQEGIVHPIEEVSDPVFAQKVLGDGIFVLPDEGRVLSPVDGMVLSVAPTGHAFGLRAVDGAEFLVHIGVDTVELGGEGFNARVSPGQRVQAGDELCRADLTAVASAGYSTETITVLTNGAEFDVTDRYTGHRVAGGEAVIEYRRIAKNS